MNLRSLAGKKSWRSRMLAVILEIINSKTIEGILRLDYIIIRIALYS
jgi:hypothetical protein